MYAETRAMAESLRSALRAEPEWAILNSLPSPVPPPGGLADMPPSYVQFVSEVANGFNCGTVMLFDSASASEMQFFAEPVEASPLTLGVDAYFCAGKLDDDPWFIKRDDGTVWFFPITSEVWWSRGRFEMVADNLVDFFMNCACGPRYREVSPHVEGQDWPDVLRRVGRMESTD